jgi:hypothetical protein
VRAALMEGGQADRPATNLGNIQVLDNHAPTPPSVVAWRLFYQVRL